MSAKKASLHLSVWGRVQQVGFRAFVAQQANLLGVSGWVRNVGRDQVEVHAEGYEETLKAFLQVVKEGPSVARVERHEAEWGQYAERYKNFKVRWF